MMKKIVVLLLLSILAFADEVQVENNVDTNTTAQDKPKSGFDAMSPMGKAAFIAISPLIVAGGVLTVTTDALIHAPVNIAKWAGDKISGLFGGDKSETKDAALDSNLTEK